MARAKTSCWEATLQWLYHCVWVLLCSSTQFNSLLEEKTPLRVQPGSSIYFWISVTPTIILVMPCLGLLKSCKRCNLYFCSCYMQLLRLQFCSVYHDLNLRTHWRKKNIILGTVLWKCIDLSSCICTLKNNGYCICIYRIPEDGGWGFWNPIFF